MIEFTNNDYLEDYVNLFSIDVKNSLINFFSRQDIINALDDNDIEYLYRLWGAGKWESFILTAVLLLSGINILDYVLEVPKRCFYGTDVFKVNLPNNISVISAEAFRNCTELLTVHMPKSIKSISSGAFTGCYDLYEITYEGTMKEWEKILKGDFWHSGRSLYIKCSDGEIKLEDNE